MTDLTEQLMGMLEARCDAAFEAATDMMRERYVEALGKQAPLIPGVYPPRAATLADPGAIPRRVSGKLQSHIDSQQIGPAHWVVGLRGGVDYAYTLEYVINHPFFEPILEASTPEIISMVGDRLRNG